MNELTLYCDFSVIKIAHKHRVILHVTCIHVHVRFQKAMEEHFKEKPDKLFTHVIVARSQPVTREPTRDADMRPEVCSDWPNLCVCVFE